MLVGAGLAALAFNTRVGADFHTRVGAIWILYQAVLFPSVQGAVEFCPDSYIENLDFTFFGYNVPSFLFPIPPDVIRATVSFSGRTALVATLATVYTTGIAGLLSEIPCDRLRRPVPVAAQALVFTVRQFSFRLNMPLNRTEAYCG